MPKTSVYLLMAWSKLSKERKFETMTVGSTKIKVFDPYDVWEEILKIHSKQYEAGKK